MPDWSLDDSHKKNPCLTLDLPGHAGKIVVRKAASWIWVGVCDAAHQTGQGYRNQSDAQQAALSWARTYVGL